MRFYIASSFRNVEHVRYTAEQLVLRGHTHTYDWTRHGKATTHAELAAIGEAEMEGVIRSDVFIMMMPAGKGSHIELGIALGTGKEVWIYSESEHVYEPEQSSTFYHLPEVKRFVGTIENLIESVSKYERVKIK